MIVDNQMDRISDKRTGVIKTRSMSSRKTSSSQTSNTEQRFLEEMLLQQSKIDEERFKLKLEAERREQALRLEVLRLKEDRMKQFMEVKYRLESEGRSVDGEMNDTQSSHRIQPTHQSELAQRSTGTNNNSKYPE